MENSLEKTKNVQKCTTLSCPVQSRKKYTMRAECFLRSKLMLMDKIVKNGHYGKTNGYSKGIYVGD